MCKRVLGHLAQGDKGGHLGGEPVAVVMVMSRLAVLGQFQALFAPPAARMGGDSSVLEVERDLVVVGFDGEHFGNGPGRRRVRVAIELDGGSCCRFALYPHVCHAADSFRRRASWYSFPCCVPTVKAIRSSKAARTKRVKNAINA